MIITLKQSYVGLTTSLSEILKFIHDLPLFLFSLDLFSSENVNDDMKYNQEYNRAEQNLSVYVIYQGTQYTICMLQVV